MDDRSERTHSKIYCDQCDKIFDSKEEYSRHVERHAGGGESCPIDSAISKILGAFKRR